MCKEGRQRFSERLKFLGRTSKGGMHTDSYLIEVIDTLGEEKTVAFQRNYTLEDRYGKTKRDKRSGAHARRISNRIAEGAHPQGNRRERKAVAR